MYSLLIMPKELNFLLLLIPDCKVNMARIIQRNRLNQIIALVEISNDFQNIKKVEFIIQKFPTFIHYLWD